MSGLLKIRADFAGEADSNGAIPYYVNWLWGPTLSLLRNLDTPRGKRTVYIQGEADTYFSIPAAYQWRGKNYYGWLGQEDGVYSFHPYKEEKEL